MISTIVTAAVWRSFAAQFISTSGTGTCTRFCSRGTQSCVAVVSSRATHQPDVHSGHPNLCRSAPEEISAKLVQHMSAALGLDWAVLSSTSPRGEVETFVSRAGHVTDWHFDFMEVRSCSSLVSIQCIRQPVAFRAAFLCAHNFVAVCLRRCGHPVTQSEPCPALSSKSIGDHFQSLLERCNTIGIASNPRLNAPLLNLL